MIDCKQLADLKLEGIKNFINKTKINPTLLIISNGENEANETYINKKVQTCKNVGISVHVKKALYNSQIKDYILQANTQKDINGIILQLPISDRELEHDHLSLIDPIKDVDCLTPANLGKLMVNSSLAFYKPCTPQACMDLLTANLTTLAGLNVVILGNSLLTGKPLIHMLTERGATVTIINENMCDIKTRLLTQNSDILIVGIGKPYFITTDYISDNTFIIDIGINKILGKVVGDVHFNVNKHFKNVYQTPVPNGVGCLTVANLIGNVYKAHLRQNTPPYALGTFLI